jgi:D-threo-aldose 1-dehydrogenase
MICSSGLPSFLSPVGKIPQPIIEKREKLREVAGRHGVDRRTAALQFSATPDIASAMIVGAASEQQIVADYSSMQVKIPAKFWGGTSAGLKSS